MPVRFAPLLLPLHRRLETLAVAVSASLFFAFAALLLYCMITPASYPFLIAYFIWIHFDDAPDKHGRRIDLARRAVIWRYLRDYFPVSLVKEAELDPSKNYVFGYHPHGIISVGLWVNFCTEANDFSGKFPGIRLHPLTLSGNLRVPFWRELLLSNGICSVSRKTCDYLLRSGQGTSIVLVPGGAREALDAHPGTNDLTLKRRRGFIKVALQNGADLVPVFSFGENDIFKQANNGDGTMLRKWQHIFLKYVGVAPCLPFGRGIFNYDFGVLPQRHPIITVVGKPIPVTKQANPSDDQVSKLQKQYIDALHEIYERYKDVYAKDRVRELNIIR